MDNLIQIIPVLDEDELNDLNTYTFGIQHTPITRS